MTAYTGGDPNIEGYFQRYFTLADAALMKVANSTVVSNMSQVGDVNIGLVAQDNVPPSKEELSKMRDAEDLMMRLYGNDFAAIDAGWKLMAEHITQENDPITGLSSFGNLILNTSVGGLLAAATMNGVREGAEDQVAGKAFNWATGGLGFVRGVWDVLSPTLFTAWMILLGLGYFLTYYLPMLPALIWYISITGWMALVVITILGAPLWVAMHTVVSRRDGDGPMNMFVMNGYQILANVLLRPTLMVLGLTAAIIILKYAAMLATFGFGFAYQSGIFATAGDTSGILLRLFGMMAAVIIFTILIIAIATSTFTLIYRVSDYVIDMLG